MRLVSAQSPPLAWGVLAFLLAAAWNTAEVNYLYGGNWTGPFYIAGETFPAGEPFDQFAVQANRGFDGQFYLLTSYDPWLRKGLAAHMDWPGLRYNRILLPALANVLSLGSPGRIPRTFVSLQWFFLGLGVWALSDFARRHGQRASYGLTFLALPAVWISLDRMVVDLALVALVVAAVNEAGARRGGSMAAALAAACLNRDTGILAAGLMAGWFLWRGERRNAAWCGLAMAPAFAWWGYVALHHDIHWHQWLPGNQPYAPFVWTGKDLLALFASEAGAARPLAGRMMDLLALTGLCLAIRFSWRNRSAAGDSLAAALCLVYALLGLYLFALGDWSHPYDYGRVLSPMLAGLLLAGAEQRRLLYALPSVLILTRVAVQMVPKSVIFGY